MSRTPVCRGCSLKQCRADLAADGFDFGCETSARKCPYAYSCVDICLYATQCAGEEALVALHKYCNILDHGSPEDRPVGE